MSGYLPVVFGAAVGLLAVMAAALVWAVCRLSGQCDPHEARGLETPAAQEPGPEPPQPDQSALLLERALAAIDGFRAAMQAYKALAEELEGRLEATRTELGDWRAAAQYHAESVRRQQAEIAEVQAQCLRLQQENGALRAAYVQRTQEALAAGLGRCVLRNN